MCSLDLILSEYTEFFVEGPSAVHLTGATSFQAQTHLLVPLLPARLGSKTAWTSISSCPVSPPCSAAARLGLKTA